MNAPFRPITADQSAAAWHLSKRAQTLLEGCRPNEFTERRKVELVGSDSIAFVPTDDLAEFKLERLEAVRRDAVEREAGCTFARADECDVKRARYLEVHAKAICVADALELTFAEREGRPPRIDRPSLDEARSFAAMIGPDLTVSHRQVAPLGAGL